MRNILKLMLVAAVTVAAAWWIAHLTGALSVQIAGLTVQSSLPVAVVALLVFMLLLFLLFRLFSAVFGLRHVIRRGGDRRTRRKGEEAVTNTLIALAAQEAADARREAARARRYLGDTPHTLLLSAYAGSMAGDHAEAEAAFAKLSEHKKASFLGLRGLLRQAVEKEDWERAAVLARDAEKAHPGAAWLAAERTHLAVRTGNWHEALQLTKGDAATAALGAAAAEAEQDPKLAHKLAKDAWKRDRALAPAALAYARRLREAGREKAAQEVLRETYAKAPHPDLADFALAPQPDRLTRLKAGTEFTAGAAGHPESQFLLARLSLDAGLPGEALRHAEAAKAAGMNQQRLFTLMADIAAADGNEEVHQDRQRTALRQANIADPDPAWCCEACGAVHNQWHAACPVCHTAGKIRWAVPARGAMAAPLLAGPTAGSLPGEV
jgi:HemY protein